MSDVKELSEVEAEGLDALYRRYAAWLAERLRRSVGPDEAADLVQDAYVRVGARVHEVRHPKTYLLRVAMNLLRDEARRQARREDARRAAAPDVDAPDQVDRLLLKQVIAAMPPLYRDVFVLNRFRGMTYAEIAAAKGVSVKTIEWRMSKALEYCAKRLDE